MANNIIHAIINLLRHPVTDLQANYVSRNRANSMGDALERYVQDLFINGFNLDEMARMQAISAHFSYMGNASNPPDAMLKGGDALEVKKIESRNADLAFNSSYPKAKLHISHPMITAGCRGAEDWVEKDMLYAVGTVEQNKLKALAFVYGEDYFAVEDVYKSLFTNVTNCNEVVKFDMPTKCYAKNPFEVFEYISPFNNAHAFKFMVIINEKKWQNFSNTNELQKIIACKPNLSLRDVQIKNPNIKNAYKNAKLITFTID